MRPRKFVTGQTASLRGAGPLQPVLITIGTGRSRIMSVVVERLLGRAN
ncbi:MAG TPA: hypothetical protein VF970_10120 [Gemmatimonadales bacterium]